ncbi:MAG TPA: DUF5667 domain-containing protein [Actinoplanes sp.]|nr:DUF5667 domain-containing protein [Actinoplanes sp.]
MILDFLDRRSAERFAELLDQTGGGPRHSNRGPADEEHAELVAIGHRLSGVRSGVGVDPEFRVGLRAMLVATAERDGIGATATEYEPGGDHAAVREPRRSLLGRAAGRRIRARGAIVIGVAAGAMAVSGISAASENAAPGDALYGVKRSTEKAQLAMAGSDVTRGQLSLDFARTRLAEAIALRDTGDFTGVLDDMDADTRQGVKLLTEAAVIRSEAGPLDRVDSFVAAQEQTFAPILTTLPAAERERANRSLVLLDHAGQRAQELRNGLACDTVVRDGADDLGPKLRDCLAGSDSSAPQERTAGQGERAAKKEPPASGDTEVQPERTGPAAVPGRTGQVTAPDGSEPAGDDGSPGAPEPDTSAPAEPRSDEDEGMLGDLLGGIFG